MTSNGFVVSNNLKDTRLSGIHGQRYDEAFANLGNEGWELVESFNHGAGAPGFVFKRPLG